MNSKCPHCENYYTAYMAHEEPTDYSLWLYIPINFCPKCGLSINVPRYPDSGQLSKYKQYALELDRELQGRNETEQG